MVRQSERTLIHRRYSEVHGACVRPAYASYCGVERDGRARAAIGFRRADAGPLFLERYLDQPVEATVALALGSRVPRSDIIELGNFAADDAFAMIALWSRAANDLATGCEVAVATLTAPLRSMLRRMSVPIHVLAPAMRERADDPAAWGRYYDTDPQVCAGWIAEGQRALASFAARRGRNAA